MRSDRDAARADLSPSSASTSRVSSGRQAATAADKPGPRPRSAASTANTTSRLGRGPAPRPSRIASGTPSPCVLAAAGPASPQRSGPWRAQRPEPCGGRARARRLAADGVDDYREVRVLTRRRAGGGLAVGGGSRHAGRPGCSIAAISAARCRRLAGRGCRCRSAPRAGPVTGAPPGARGSAPSRRCTGRSCGSPARKRGQLGVVQVQARRDDSRRSASIAAWFCEVGGTMPPPRSGRPRRAGSGGRAARAVPR